MKPLVTIGLGTRDRSEMLREALVSLENLVIPNEVSIQLLVCENGVSNTAEKIVVDLKQKLPFKVKFIIEEKEGIVYMRNRILDEAIKSESEMLAFFDDDEVVDKNWLVKLLEAKEKFSADIVQGHIIQNFPDVDNLDLVKEFFPGSFKKETGADLLEAYTNNVLFDLSLVRNSSIRFDAKFNLTGGSDSFFFSQLKKNSASIIFCKEAIVTEKIPTSRASIDWVLSRFYRNGYTKYHIDKMKFGKIRALTRGIQMVYRAVKKCVFTKKKTKLEKTVEGILLQKRCLRAKGTFHAMLGVPFAEYDVIHGD